MAAKQFKKRVCITEVCEVVK